MNFSFQNCIISEYGFPSRQFQELLQNKETADFVLLDLLKLENEFNKLGEENIVLLYLSGKEHAYWKKLTLGKRKREWLGGRIAAKYIAAKALELAGPENIEPLWPDLEIIADDNGRPFLAIANQKTDSRLPDISISHSRTMVAAMAVSRGRCGVDIQKITSRILKVKDRFCTPEEEQTLQIFFKPPGIETTLLTKLWAAKETLRKVSNWRSLPGFLELKLVKIVAESSGSGQGPWKFVLHWKNQKHEVAVALVEDYALALTAMNDTVN